MENSNIWTKIFGFNVIPTEREKQEYIDATKNALKGLFDFNPFSDNLEDFEKILSGETTKDIETLQNIMFNVNAQLNLADKNRPQNINLIG